MNNKELQALVKIVMSMATQIKKYKKTIRIKIPCIAHLPQQNYWLWNLSINCVVIQSMYGIRKR